MQNNAKQCKTKQNKTKLNETKRSKTKFSSVGYLTFIHMIICVTQSFYVNTTTSILKNINNYITL